jgi:hypothetical protein
MVNIWAWHYIYVDLSYIHLYWVIFEMVNCILSCMRWVSDLDSFILYINLPLMICIGSFICMKPESILWTSSFGPVRSWTKDQKIHLSPSKNNNPSHFGRNIGWGVGGGGGGCLSNPLGRGALSLCIGLIASFSSSQITASPTDSNSVLTKWISLSPQVKLCYGFGSGPAALWQLDAWQTL